MDDSALVEEVLGDDDEETPTNLLLRRRRKRGCSEPSSDSASVSLSDQELLSRSPTTTPKKIRKVFRHRKIALSRSKSKENRITSSLDLLSELKKTNATMVVLAEKGKKAEKRMRNMEKNVKRSSSSNGSSSSSNNSSPGSSLKKNVPLGIRVRYV